MPLPSSLTGKPRVPAPEPLPAPVIDAHTHLDATGADTDEQIAPALRRAADAGVEAVVTVADDLASARWAAQAAGRHATLAAAVALHPTRSDALDDAARTELAELAALPQVVAVGETGLDHYWPSRGVGTDPAVQAEAFAWHIQLAKDVGKPLMIHDRDAHAQVLDVLAADGAPEQVIFHCFSGDEAFARRCTEQGWYLSFAGPVSFRNAPELRRAVTVVPDELLLAETDAPFLTPHPHRGTVNEPAALPYTVRAIADLRASGATGATGEPRPAGSEELADTCRLLAANARRVYRL